MDEILYELRERSVGLNAGRWDYIFSIIKKLGHRPDAVLPDRSQVGMTVPFMQAYCELLVRTCHRRGAHAMGGMAAFVPSRKDPEVTAKALAKVREDKEREVAQGFDGTWVAHPDLVPVAMDVFDRALGASPNQLDRPVREAEHGRDRLLDFRVPAGAITEAGVRNNVSVGLQYTESWLRGTGAVAIHHLMEDAATAEIARSQLWQWCQHGARADGSPVTKDRVRRILDEELEKMRTALGPSFEQGRWKEARELFEDAALRDEFVEFLTLPAYDHIAQERAA
jgi:malate synthase